MWKLTIILLFVMLGAAAALAMEKIPDLQNRTAPADFHSFLTGSLTPNSPTYDRAFGDQVSNLCDAPLVD